MRVFFPVGDCVHSKAEQMRTNHGHFINADKAGPDRAILSRRKSAGIVGRDQPAGMMDCIGRHVRAVRHTLCGKSRRRHQQDGVLRKHLVVNIHYRAQRGRFTSAGAACYNRAAVFEIADRLRLFGAENNTVLPLPFHKCLFDFSFLVGGSTHKASNMVCQ